MVSTRAIAAYMHMLLQQVHHTRMPCAHTDTPARTLNPGGIFVVRPRCQDPTHGSADGRLSGSCTVPGDAGSWETLTLASIRQADTTSCVRYATGDSARRSMQWCARRSDRHEKHAHKALLVLCARVCLLAPRRAATSLVVAALTQLIRAAILRVVVHHPGDRDEQQHRSAAGAGRSSDGRLCVCAMACRRRPAALCMQHVACNHSR